MCTFEYAEKKCQQVLVLENAKKYTVHGGFNFSTKALHYLSYFLLYGSTHGKGRHHYFYSYCLQLPPLSSNWKLLRSKSV